MGVAMKFIDRGTDVWHEVDDSDSAMPAVSAPHQVQSRERWLAVRAQWPEAMPVGVKIACDVDIETLAPALDGLSLVVLDFPKWVDGRAYSQAHLLRFRFRFAGEIRAAGDVVVDMLPLLKRTGFDAVLLRADQSQAVAERALRFFEGHYQGDATVHTPHFASAA